MSEGPQPDEWARRCALTYASSTLHFVRRTTHKTSSIDPSDSFLQKVATYHGHPGKPPIRVDHLAQEFLNAVVIESPPHPSIGTRYSIIGEEIAGQAVSRETDIVIRCDPVDGTSNLSHCGDGFSTVVTIERKDAAGDWSHLGGAIVRNDGDAISWSRAAVYRHDVVIDFHPLPPSDVPQLLNKSIVAPFSSWSLDEDFEERLITSGATVAAHNLKRRARLVSEYPRLVSTPEYFDFRSGSTSAWGLCNRRLGFVFELNPTTIHDSAHLFPFSILLGGKVVDHQYRPMNVRKIIDSNAGPTAEDKVVPPYIAYVDDRSLEFIRSCID